MEFSSLLAWWNPLTPIISALTTVLNVIDSHTHSIGWSLVLLAAAISIALWPLRHKQFTSAKTMQKLSPELKAIQAKYKGDPTKLNAATMELYKERGVNPLASCFPLLLSMPILLSVFQAINGDAERFKDGHWLWIGTPFSQSSPYHILAANLHEMDYVLLALYIVSMYFSFKLAAPSTDPAQAQQQRIMAFASPAMIGFFAIKSAWPSALIVYWLSSNLFTMAQQYLSTRGGPPASAAAPVAAIVDVPAGKAAKGMRAAKGTAALPAGGGGKNGQSGAKTGAAGNGVAMNGSSKNGASKNGSSAGGGRPSGGPPKNGASNGAAKPGTNAAAKRPRAGGKDN